LIGKRYKEEKKALGNDKQTIKEQVKQVNTQVVGHNALPLDDKSTSAKIAEQSKVSPKTQYEEDESGVVTVTTPKKTELK
jgi:hypothetical protein